MKNFNWLTFTPLSNRFIWSFTNTTYMQLSLWETIFVSKKLKIRFFFRFGFQIINVSLTNKLVVVLHFFVGFHFSVSEDKLKLKPNQSREAASTKVGYII
jgi:hypothetical protein